MPVPAVTEEIRMQLTWSHPDWATEIESRARPAEPACVPVPSANEGVPASVMAGE